SAPGAEIVAGPGKAGQPQRVVRMSGAVTALAVGDYLLIGRKPQALERSPEFLRRFEFSSRVEVQAPVAVDCSRNRAAAFGPHVFAVIFGLAAHVEDSHRATAQRV